MSSKEATAKVVVKSGKGSGKRGAPKGVKRGPRALYFIVQGIKDGSPFMDQIPANDAAQAQATFEEVHGVKALGNSLGAFYEQKGKGASKNSLSIDVNSLKFTGITKIAEHRGWKCKVLLSDDPAIGFVVYTNPINPDEVKSKRSKPQPRPMPLRELSNLTEG